MVKKASGVQGKPVLPEGIEDHGRFQRLFWMVQRAAWIVFAMVLVACLLGLLGRGGPFSTNTMALPGGSIILPSIAQWNAPDEMVVTFEPTARDGTLFFDARFLDAFSIEGVDPPQKETIRHDGLVGYVFTKDPFNPTKIIFRLQTQQVGFGSYRIGIENDVFGHSTFILP